MSQTANLQAIADAIRAKDGSSDPIPANTFADRIAAMQTGAQLPTLTNPGTAADLLAGKELIDQDGNPIAGTMQKVEQATPSISVSSAGLITASATQTAGYVAEGTKSATKQLTAKAAATITPGTANQTIAAGTYLTGAQTIKGDANLVAENIKSGVTIFGTAGTYSGDKLIYYIDSSNGTSYAWTVAITVSGNVYTYKITIPIAMSELASLTLTTVINSTLLGLYYVSGQRLMTLHSGLVNVCDSGTTQVTYLSTSTQIVAKYSSLSALSTGSASPSSGGGIIALAYKS